MKKYIIICGLLFLVGCSNGLDTSKLSESKKGEGESIKFYSASSVEVAIDALPYEVNLPETLPFQSDGFNSLGITDTVVQVKIQKACLWQKMKKKIA